MPTKKRIRRCYTESQKAEALAVLLANNKNVNRTAKQLCISRGALRRWIEAEQRERLQKQQESKEEAEKVEQAEAKLPGLTVAQLRQKKKNDLASAFDDIAWMCVTRLSQSELLEKSVKPVELSTVAGTAVDKSRLLKGESTVITETRLENHRWAEEQLQRVMREFQMTREQALTEIKEKAPTWAEMLM